MWLRHEVPWKYSGDVIDTILAACQGASLSDLEQLVIDARSYLLGLAAIRRHDVDLLPSAAIRPATPCRVRCSLIRTPVISSNGKAEGALAVFRLMINSTLVAC